MGVVTRRRARRESGIRRWAISFPCRSSLAVGGRGRWYVTVVVVMSLGSREMTVVVWAAGSMKTIRHAVVSPMTKALTTTCLPVFASYVANSAALWSRGRSSLMVVSELASVKLMRFFKDWDVSGSCRKGVVEEVWVF